MKKKQHVLLILILCLGIGLTACKKVSDTGDTLDVGADLFAAGKEEKDYGVPHTGNMLEQLLDNYSDSRQIPTDTPMDEDTYDDLVDDDSSKGEKIVKNADDMKDIFHDAYDNTLETVQFKVDGYTITGEDLQYVYTQLQREDPYDVCCVASWSYREQNNKVVVSITYNIDIDTLKTMKAETRNLVKEAVAKIDKKGKSQYELVDEVNEYLCDVSEYPEKEPYEPVTHTAYGAFHNGLSVCEGYACAAKMMLNELGIVCDIEVGECINGGGHAWNLVQLEEKWYQLDVTWNDGGGDRKTYFLVTDAFMKKSRTWKESLYPVCAAKPYRP